MPLQRTSEKPKQGQAVPSEWVAGLAPELALPVSSFGCGFSRMSTGHLVSQRGGPISGSPDSLLTLLGGGLGETG